MDGFHVEGPHISPRTVRAERIRGAGCGPRIVDEFRRWQDATGGRVRIVTLAPEWPEAPGYIETITAEGVVAAIGHTQATRRRSPMRFRAGATLSTHLGNGAHPVLRRHPNYIWDQMAEDRLMAELHRGWDPPGCRLSEGGASGEGPRRSVLVTDAATPAGAAPGRYRLGEQDVDLTADGRVVLAGTDRLAGSALRMDRGVENLMRLCGLRLADAVRMATVNAARAGACSRAGAAGSSRGIAPISCSSG